MGRLDQNINDKSNKKCAIMKNQIGILKLNKLTIGFKIQFTRKQQVRLSKTKHF